MANSGSRFKQINNLRRLVSNSGVPAAVERAVAAGARLVQGAEQMPWGQTVAYVADINDALVELCTPMAPPPAA